MKTLMAIKITKTIFIAILLFTHSIQTTAQNEPKAIFVDELTNIFCTEDNQARLDSLMVELQNRPGSTGYVIGHADRAIPGRFLKYQATYKMHVPYRRFDPDRVKFLRGEDLGQMTFRFWVVPEGAEPPTPVIPYSPARIVKQALFDSSSIVSIIGGKVNFGFDVKGDGEPCDWGLRLDHYAEALAEDTDLVGHLVVYSDNKRGRSFVNRAAQMTVKELAFKHGISAKRLKTTYAGKSEFSKIELWLVPGSDTLTFN